MKVNKNSWHYKAVTEGTLGVGGFSQYSVSHSLCVYFWQVVGSILLKGSMLLVVLPSILTLLVVLPLSSLVGWLVTGNFVDGDLGIVVIFIEVFWVLAIAILHGIYALHNKYEDYKHSKSLKESIDKEPSLIGQYIKAKKEKICPVIEFTEE